MSGGGRALGERLGGRQPVRLCQHAEPSAPSRPSCLSPHQKPHLSPPLPFLPAALTASPAFHSKFQYLSSTLLRISSQLNGVLGVLGGLNPPPPLASTPAPGPPWSSRSTPLPACPAQVSASPPASRPHGAWDPGLSLGLSASVTQTVDDLLMAKWRKYFPGKPPPPPSPRAVSSSADPSGTPGSAFGWAALQLGAPWVTTAQRNPKGPWCDPRASHHGTVGRHSRSVLMKSHCAEGGTGAQAVM